MGLNKGWHLSLCIVFEGMVPGSVTRVLSCLLGGVIIVPGRVVGVRGVGWIPFFVTLASFLYLVARGVVTVPIVSTGVPRERV